MLWADGRHALPSKQIRCWRLWMPWLTFRKFGDNFSQRGAAFSHFIGCERNCTYDSVTTSAIPLANRGDVVTSRTRCPGIRADRDFGSFCSASKRHGVSRLRKQIVRNKFIEAFIALIDQIELHHTISIDRFSFDCLKRVAMKLQNRLESCHDAVTGRDLTQSFHGEIANNLFDKRFV